MLDDCPRAPLGQAHLRATNRLAHRLNQELPIRLEAFVAPDVVVGPAVTRIPDVVVTASEWRDERRLAVDEVLLAVEIISPGSWREDLIVKPVEYAEAGIPHLWIISLADGPVTLASYQLVEGDRHYRQQRPLTGVVDIALPWPLSLDLDALTAPR